MRRPPPDRIDLFTSVARSALEDVRGKLIDEGWFGRPTAERQQAYADMRDLYGRAPEPPKGWGEINWSDRLKEQPRSPTEDKGWDIER